MDIISQLQDQVNAIAAIAVDIFGTLQKDAPPVRLSPNYPEPPANPSDENVNIPELTKTMSGALVQAAKKVGTCFLLFKDSSFLKFHVF